MNVKKWKLLLLLLTLVLLLPGCGANRDMKLKGISDARGIAIGSNFSSAVAPVTEEEDFQMLLELFDGLQLTQAAEKIESKSCLHILFYEGEEYEDETILRSVYLDRKNRIRVKDKTGQFVNKNTYTAEGVSHDKILKLFEKYSGQKFS